MDAGKKYKTVDQYIADFPSDVQGRLQVMRETIKKNAPAAEELISYNIPAFKLEGILVYFGGFKNHIGFFPRTSGISTFQKELSVYKGAKGSVQFPFDKPLPTGLIGKIVKYRVKENLEKVNAKKKPAKKKSASKKAVK